MSMKKMLSGILSIAGNLGSFFGGIFSALQFFIKQDDQKSRKIVWRVYQLGSLRVTEFSFKESERVQ